MEKCKRSTFFFFFKVKSNNIKVLVTDNLSKNFQKNQKSKHLSEKEEKTKLKKKNSLKLWK